MVCIYCKQKTHVTNSRSSIKTNSTWRRRQCSGCNAVFTTKEAPDLSESVRIEETSKDLLPFDRDKLFVSVHAALSHRKTATKDAAAITSTITEKLMQNKNTGVFSATEVIHHAYETLKNFDYAAATYYAVRHIKK